MNRIIVIAPHADDEILGCGATIAKYVSHGSEIFVIIATNASKGDARMFPAEKVERVRKEALEAHKLLGVKETFFFDFPAPALNAYPEYKISLIFSDVFNNVKPTSIFIPHPSDLHQDHKAIYRAAVVSARPIASHKISSIYCYETLSETNWSLFATDNSFNPNCYIDVSDHFEKKLEAMNLFKSQLKEYPHCRSLLALEALAMYRGSTINVPRAEAFVIERKIV